MRTLRNPFLNWLVEHPTAAGFAVVGAGIVLLALLPILLYVLPIRKVPLRYNLRNLQNRWKTTLVTALAFTFVTGLLTGMLSFVRGMDRLTESSGHPGNVIVLSDGATDEAFSNLPPMAVEQLPRDLQREVQKTEDGQWLFSKEVYVIVMYMIPNPSAGGRERRFVQMRGLDNIPVAAAVHDVKLAVGDWPREPFVRKVDGFGNAKEIVIGHGVARAFGSDVGKKMLEPGDTVVLGPETWVVSGVMEEGGNSFGSEIWTRDLFVQQGFGRENSYCSYVVRTASADKAKLAAQEIKNFKLERNLQAFTERAYYAKMSETSKQFSFAIYIVAVIMAIGGVLGVMNTMYAAISQRGKDIGVLRLMGYRRWQILLSFQLESLLIALLGGVLVCVVAFLLFNGTTVSSIISSGVGGGGKSVVLRLIFDTFVFGFGLTFSLLMGALGGFFPSLSAMRLRPLESLR
ncbi:MAG: ABC transporter permease [Planctomycetes bacterium]|nr:ABC transporter permease [Planctomycetota bacterium]